MVGPPVCLYMYNKFCPSTIPCTLESSCLSVNSSRWNCDGEREIREYRSAALGLWEGLSHSALLRSIVIVLKSHSALLRLIVIVFKLVAAKNNWLVHSKLEIER